MRTDQAAGGTNQPHVPAVAFSMPPGMRLRYDVPAPDLRSCVSGYAIYIADERAAMTNWYLPAPAMIVILLDAGPVCVALRNRAFDTIDRASVWGPTSHAYRTTTHGGISVGIGLTAAGWARLAAGSAEAVRDRVVPLSTLVAPAVAKELVAALNALDDDAAIAPLLDAMLPRLFAPDHGAEALLRALDRLVVTDGVIGVEDVAGRLGTDIRELRRIARDHFGMMPKTLLTRARFIRSFAGWLASGEPPSYAGIDASYFDAAHFLHDAQRYLGTTPRRFARRETHYLRASLHARAAVIGASTHVLHASAGIGQRLPEPRRSAPPAQRDQSKLG